MGQIDRSSRGGQPETRDFTLASLMRQAASLTPERRSELQSYLRELDQRCWVCKRPDGEQIRLERRDAGRWTAVGTVLLCSGCVLALTTPALGRALGLSRAEEASTRVHWIDGSGEVATTGFASAATPESVASVQELELAPGA